jgi:hypothetical protein
MKELGPKSETFHLFNPKSGEAISTQILHTLAPIYMPIHKQFMTR